jgi:hypothetical protein
MGGERDSCCASFPACGFAELSRSVFTQYGLGTGKSSEPTDRNVCATIVTICACNIRRVFARSMRHEHLPTRAREPEGHFRLPLARNPLSSPPSACGVFQEVVELTSWPSKIASGMQHLARFSFRVMQVSDRAYLLFPLARLHQFVEVHSGGLVTNRYVDFALARRAAAEIFKVSLFFCLPPSSSLGFRYLRAQHRRPVLRCGCQPFACAPRAGGCRG